MNYFELVECEGEFSELREWNGQGVECSIHCIDTLLREYKDRLNAAIKQKKEGYVGFLFTFPNLY